MSLNLDPWRRLPLTRAVAWAAVTVALTLCGVLPSDEPLLAEESGAAEAPGVYAPARSEFYRQYFEQAAVEALPPEEEISLDDRERLLRDLRRTSRLWANAASGELVLAASTFVLTHTALQRPPKGEPLIEAIPIRGRTTTYTGSYRLSGHQLTLRIGTLDGTELNEPREVRGACHGSEIEMYTSMEENGMFRQPLYWRVPNK